MLEKETIKEIEEKVGYTFKNKALLTQAFTRSSYAEEDKMKGGKGLSNEQLEFYGDSVLNYVIVDTIAQEKAALDKDGNLISKSQEELTNFISFWTDKTMLSSKIQELDISKYLIMSKGDITRNVSQNLSAMEDLFESIIGAIWFDTNKNMKKITSIVHNLLGITFDDVCFRKNSYTKLKEFIDKNPDFKAEMKKQDNGYVFYLIGPEATLSPTFRSCGTMTFNYHLSQADCAYQAIEFLKKCGRWEDKRKEIPTDVTLENAINYLQQAVQKKLMTSPNYVFEFDYQNCLWKTRITFTNGSFFVATSKEKIASKKEAALQAYKYFLKNYGHMVF